MVIRQQLSYPNFAELLRYLHSPGLFMILPSEILEIHMYCACLANLHYINIFFTHVWCHVFYIICCHIFRKHCCDHTGKSTAMDSAVTSSGLFDEHFCQSQGYRNRLFCLILSCKTVLQPFPGRITGFGDAL